MTCTSRRRQSARPRWSSQWCGERLPDCDHLFFRTDGTPNDVWPGDPGTLLGCADFVEAQLAEKSCWRGFQRCPISNVRGSCCSVQHKEPVTSSELSIPNTVSSSPLRHDTGIRQCFENLVHAPITHKVWGIASLPFGIGGLS